MIVYLANRVEAQKGHKNYLNYGNKWGSISISHFSFIINFFQSFFSPVENQILQPQETQLGSANKTPSSL